MKEYRQVHHLQTNLMLCLLFLVMTNSDVTSQWLLFMTELNLSGKTNN